MGGLGQHPVAVVLQVGPLHVEGGAVTGGDDLRLEGQQLVHGAQEAVPLHVVGVDHVVPDAHRPVRHHRLEVVVPGEGDPAPAEASQEGHLVLRVPGGVHHGQVEAPPAHRLPVSQGAVDPDGLGVGAAQEVPLGVLQDVFHVLVGPHPRPVLALEEGEAVEVVVVHVGGHGDVYPAQAVAGAQLGEGVLHEAHPVAPVQAGVEGGEEARRWRSRSRRRGRSPSGAMRA